MCFIRRGEHLVEANPVSDYVFYFSYIQPPPVEKDILWSDQDEMCKANGKLSTI